MLKVVVKSFLLDIFAPYKSLKGSITDLILTNRPRSFQKTSVCGIGLGMIHI